MSPKKKASQKIKTAGIKAVASLAAPSDYQQLLAAIKSRIQTARVQAHLAANRELVRLYWDLGRLIVERQKIEGWGKAVIEKLSTDLSQEFPEMSGFTSRNLWLIRKFYLAHSEGLENLKQAVAELADSSAVPQPLAVVFETGSVLAQSARELLKQAVSEVEIGSCPEALLAIPWGHNIKLFQKLKDPVLRLWYAAQTSQHGWSRAVLVHQIESELHLRATSQSNNFAATLTDPQSDLARELIKDSFNLEFLDIRESIRERELEESLIANLRDFLLELGTDEGVPLAVAKRVFGEDPKAIIEELNQALIA
ncbi:MAG: PDDEXK nuclease domain-containing protein [Verrucomicrobiales bacterium]|nr:PDDEXK nuclease domain-containing protein [Verrucomicrobiales bacterium]